MDVRTLADVAARIAGAADDQDAEAATRALLAERVPVRDRDDPEVRALLEVVDALLADGARLRTTARLAALGQMAGGLAHELSNALSAIQLHAAVGEVEQVRAIADASSDLVRAVLAISRGDAPPRASADLADAVRGALPRLQRRAAGVDIAAQLPEEPCVVGVSRGGLEHVLVNLVANAVNAMRGGGTITIAVHTDGAFAEMTVADTGPGIPDDVRHRVLEPFFTTRAEDGGTGLGLAVVRAIAGHGGGTVELASAPGEGTTALVRLPLVGG